MSDNQRIDAPEQLGVNEQGNWVYPSGAASGHIQVELPALPGSITPTETLLIKDFGGHVSNKIESAMQCTYLKGPQQGPVATLKHYAAVARGASLMDEAALKRMETLATEFESVPERQAYFEHVVRPYLLTLAPRRR